MTESLQKLQGRWVMLAKRERLMLFLVGLFAIAGLLDTYLIEPVRQNMQATTAELTTLQAQTAKLVQDMANLKQGIGAHQRSPLQSEMLALQAKVAGQEAMLARLGDLMVTPANILPLMKQVLSRHADVQMLSLESLPPVGFVEKHLQGNVADTAPTSESLNVSHIYQHSLRLKLTGNYMAVMRYVVDLKSMGHRIAWENAQMVANYPSCELTLEVFTLSTQRAWLGV